MVGPLPFETWNQEPVAEQPPPAETHDQLLIPRDVLESLAGHGLAAAQELIGEAAVTNVIDLNAYRQEHAAPPAPAPKKFEMPEDPTTLVYKDKLTEAQRKLVLDNFWLVDKIAGSFGTHASYDYDDLFQDGCAGLVEAAKKFNPREGTKFESYAQYRINGAMVDRIRKLTALTRGEHKAIQNYLAAETVLMRRLKRIPTVGELAAELGIDVEDVEDILYNYNRQYEKSLDAVVEADDGSEVGFQPVDESAESEIESEPDRMMIGQFLDKLPPRERFVIIEYYFDGLTLREIGESLGVTESRVSQLHTKALSRMNAWANGRPYKSELWDE